jgi:starvation-inducible DNA-binding protein
MVQQVLRTRPKTEELESGIQGDRVIADALLGILGDSLVLLHKTQGYHWNVVGPLFRPLHELTETQYEALFEAIDVLAERIRALGHLAPSSMADMLSHADLLEEDGTPNAHGMIERLIADNEALVRRLRETAAIAAQQDDGATEDLMNTLMADHEKAIWMLRAISAS